MIRYILSFSAIALVSAVVGISAITLIRYSLISDNNLALITHLTVPNVGASRQSLDSGLAGYTSKLCESSRTSLILPPDCRTLSQVLVANGYSDTFTFRKNLAAKLGLDPYQGTIDQNSLLLKRLISGKNQSVCLLNSIWI